MLVRNTQDVKNFPGFTDAGGLEELSGVRPPAHSSERIPMEHGNATSEEKCMIHPACFFPGGLLPNPGGVEKLPAAEPAMSPFETEARMPPKSSVMMTPAKSCTDSPGTENILPNSGYARVSRELGQQIHREGMDHPILARKWQRISGYLFENSEQRRNHLLVPRDGLPDAGLWKAAIGPVAVGLSGGPTHPPWRQPASIASWSTRPTPSVSLRCGVL